MGEGHESRSEIKYGPDNHGVLRKQREVRRIEAEEAPDGGRGEIHVERRPQKILLLLISIERFRSVADEIREHRVANEPVARAVEEMSFAAEETERHSPREAKRQRNCVDRGVEQAALPRLAPQYGDRARGGDQNHGGRQRAKRRGENAVWQHEEKRGEDKDVGVAKAADTQRGYFSRRRKPAHILS